MINVSPDVSSLMNAQVTLIGKKDKTKGNKVLLIEVEEISNLDMVKYNFREALVVSMTVCIVTKYLGLLGHKEVMDFWGWFCQHVSIFLFILMNTLLWNLTLIFT